MNTMSKLKFKKVSIEKCSFHYNIETSFIQELNERGLIKLTFFQKNHYLDYKQLTALEKYIRLYFDLKINMEGIEAISHLLLRLEKIENEKKQLKNELTAVYKTLDLDIGQS